MKIMEKKGESCVWKVFVQGWLKKYITHLMDGGWGSSKTTMYYAVLEKLFLLH